MKPQKYQKKPVVIEAVQFHGSSAQATAIQNWIKHGEYREPLINTRDTTSFVIPTLEGDMRVRPGDYVIRGIQGEFYPVKPDIFEATYTPATEVW